MATKKKTVTVKKGRSIKPSTLDMKVPPHRTFKAAVSDDEQPEDTPVSVSLAFLAEKAATLVLEKIGPEMRDTFAAMERKLAVDRAPAETTYAPKQRVEDHTPPPPAPTTRIFAAVESIDLVVGAYGKAVDEAATKLMAVVNIEALAEEDAAFISEPRPIDCTLLETVLYDLRERIVHHNNLLIALVRNCAV
jgi:hypothetical protein